MHTAAERMQVPIPGDLAEAIDYFDALANREDLAMRFVLEALSDRGHRAARW
jgi:hypothetical protein